MKHQRHELRGIIVAFGEVRPCSAKAALAVVAVGERAVGLEVQPEPEFKARIGQREVVVLAFRDLATDFIEFGSESECKSAGKLKTQGKEYVVEDGDIIFFKFNPPKSGKKT